MQTLEDVLHEAMSQAQRDGYVLAIDYRPGDEQPWWLGSVSIKGDTATGVVSEVDGLSLHDVLARWITRTTPTILLDH